MSPRNRRRLIILGLILGGPIVGVAVRGDRGLLFGLIVSALAAIWFLVEEFRLM